MSLTHGVHQATVDDLHRANAGGAGRDSELESRHILTPALASFGKNVVRNTLLFSGTPSVGDVDLDRSSLLPSPRHDELKNIETSPHPEFPNVPSPAQQHSPPASPSRSRGLSPCLDTSPIYSSSASSGFNPLLPTDAVISGADVGTEGREGEGVAGSEAPDSGAALWAASQGCGASAWTGLAETTSHADETFQEVSATSLSPADAIASPSLYPASPSAAAQTQLPVTQQRSFNLQASLHLPQQSMSVVPAAVADSHLDEKTDDQATHAVPLNVEVTISSPVVALGIQKLQLEKVRQESQVCGQRNLRV